MRNHADIIAKIIDIEEQLKELRLTLVEQEDERIAERLATDLEVGDFARILNPSFGQESIGRVVKVNRNTGFVTLSGKRFGLRIIRKKNNLQKID